MERNADGNDVDREKEALSPWWHLTENQSNNDETCNDLGRRLTIMKNFLKNTLLVFLSLAIGIFLCELAIRLIAPQRFDSYRPIYDPDDELVYKLKKNYKAVYAQPEFEIREETNSIGLRDHEIASKTPDCFRILGLGDSFSYSNSVNLEDTYFKRIESCLNASTGRKFEVVDAAVPAYSVIQEVRYFKRDGIMLKPDMVLLGFYVGNDFQDSYELFDSLGNPTISVADGHIITNDRFPSARYDRQERWLRTATLSLRMFLASHSALYIFLRERFSEFLWRMGLRNNPPPPDFCAKSFSLEMQKGWKLVQQLLLELAAFTSQHHVRLIIVALPTQYQVHEELWRHHFSTFGLDPNLYDLSKPQEILKEFCEQHQIEYIDVMPAMRSVGKERRLFYPIASYMNPEGHQLVADVVCKYLLSHPKWKSLGTDQY
jgi:hypothetical protein